MISIRPADSDDLILIQQLAHQIWRITFKDILSDEQINYMLQLMYSLQALQKQVNEKRHLFIIGKYENVDVGFTSYELNYKSSSTKIHKLYVLPSCQGKGLGKRFVEEIAISALHNNNDKLLLNVNKKNPAILFYEKIGFRQVAQETISIGNGYVMDDYVMEKSLT